MSKEELKNKLKALADKYENDKINIYQHLLNALWIGKEAL